MRAELLRRASDVLNTLRRLVPGPLLPLVVALRTRLAWAIPSVRADARRQMEFVLGETDPGADLDAVARRYVAAMSHRAEVRWHPEIATDLEVQGFENLKEAHAHGRGVILSFLHFGCYEAVWPSIRSNGITPHTIVYPYMLAEDAPGWIKQHIHVATTEGAVAIPSDVGSAAMLELLDQGHAVAIASDVPGRTPVRFLGRDVLGSFGAARLAQAAEAPVVLLTTERVHGRPVVRLLPALDPAAYGSAEELLQAILARHEAAVLAWPEQYDLPLSRWRPA